MEGPRVVEKHGNKAEDYINISLMNRHSFSWLLSSSLEMESSTKKKLFVTEFLVLGNLN